MLRRKQQPTAQACMHCDDEGVTGAYKGKTIYGRFWRWLTQRHSGRGASQHLNYKATAESQTPVPPVNTPAPPMRRLEDLRPDRSPGAPVTEANEMAKACELWRLPYWDPTIMASPDVMHTMGGVVKKLFAVIGNGVGDNALAYDQQVNR
jgi:hypothetical protein